MNVDDIVAGDGHRDALRLRATAFTADSADSMGDRAAVRGLRV
jgi:hypothetical protein